MSTKSKVGLCVLGIVGLRVVGYLAFKYANHVDEANNALKEEQEAETLNEMFNNII